MRRYLSQLWCGLTTGHRRLWGIGPKGVVWRCQECLHEQPSVLRHLKPGQLS